MRIAGYVQIMSIFYWTFVKILENACDSFRDVRFFFCFVRGNDSRANRPSSRLAFACRDWSEELYAQFVRLPLAIGTISEGEQL